MPRPCGRRAMRSAAWTASRPPAQRQARHRRSRSIIGDVRDPAAVDRRCPAWTRWPPGRHGRAGRRPVRPAGLLGLNVHGTAVLLAAMARHGPGRLALRPRWWSTARAPTTAPARPGAAGPEPADLAAGASTRAARRAARRWRPRGGEDTPLDPRNAYATTKLAQEHLAASWARHTGGTAVALRYHNVYGPGMPGTPLTRGWRRSSGPRWRPAWLPGCSRTAASGATSCTCGTWPGQPGGPVALLGRRLAACVLQRGRW